MIVYFNDKYLQLEKVSISPFDRGFMFADGVYESIRTYNRKLFYYKEHLQRLQKNLNELQIRYTGLEKLKEIIYDLIKKNKIHGEALIYLQITRGTSLTRTHSFPREEVIPTVFISASTFESAKREQKNGIKVILHEDLRWLRCDIKSTSLLPVILANQKAVEAGAKEAILIRAGMVTEGTHTNLFGVKDNVIYTAPVSHYILEGITRGFVIELANDLNINVREEFIKEKDLKFFNEFFITSTTKEITPVVQIDERKIESGEPGGVTKKLQTAFHRITKDYN